MARADARAPGSGALAGTPITIVHGAGDRVRRGLALSFDRHRRRRRPRIVGLAASTSIHSLAAAAAPLASVDLTSRWVTLPMTAMLISALIATVAAYVIFADE